jgi:hypothetical protein
MSPDQSAKARVLAVDDFKPALNENGFAGFQGPLAFALGTCPDTDVIRSLKAFPCAFQHLGFGPFRIPNQEMDFLDAAPFQDRVDLG